ncbi:hypothetical protein XI09_40970 [Bradyrhizobium sp. CCBAU 11386]|nr:hypothetical protein [Bradyrhizobium sp. CCBAU 11386]
MALFNKREEDKRLTSARSDLDAAQRKLSTLLARESVASASADRWAQWTAERDAAQAELARCSARVGHLEAAAEAAKREAENAEILRQVEACRAKNAAVKDRIGTDGRALITGLMALARDAAEATLEAQRLNAILPPGVPPIEIGDYAARDTLSEPRRDIATTEQILWVDAAGSPIGDPDSVVANKDGETGYVAINRSMRLTCYKRRFRSTTYHPPLALDHPGHFFQSIRLPFVDRPGTAFDGTYALIETVAAMPIELPPLPKPSTRPLMVELTPIDPWPPAGMAPTEASWNIDA